MPTYALSRSLPLKQRKPPSPKGRINRLEKVEALSNPPIPQLEAAPPTTFPQAQTPPSTRWLFFLAGAYVLGKLAWQGFEANSLVRGLFFSSLELGLLSFYVPWHKFKKGSALLLSLAALVLMSTGMLSLTS